MTYCHMIFTYVYMYMCTHKHIYMYIHTDTYTVTHMRHQIQTNPRFAKQRAGKPFPLHGSRLQRAFKVTGSFEHWERRV